MKHYDMDERDERLKDGGGASALIGQDPGFDYEAHERLKKELEADAAIDAKLRQDDRLMGEQLDAETSDANEDEELVHDSGELPPFWKPEVVGEAVKGKITPLGESRLSN